MLDCMGKSVDDTMKMKVKGSKFIGVIADESVDIAIFKKLCVYVQIVDRGEAKVMFVMDKDVPDGKADTISNAIKRDGHQ